VRLGARKLPEIKELLIGDVKDRKRKLPAFGLSYGAEVVFSPGEDVRQMKIAKHEGAQVPLATEGHSECFLKASHVVMPREKGYPEKG
jgi:hypothetical protein